MKDAKLSAVIQALETAHQSIKEKTGAPDSIITVGRSKKIHGHFTVAKVWKGKEDAFHEIFLSAPSFARGARATLGTLLHEVAHSINLKNGVSDTSVNQYHNKNFKETAEKLGLEIGQVSRKGWTDTKVPDSCVEKWSEEFKTIEEALNLFAVNDAENGKKGRNKNLIKAVCQCGEVIRLSQKVLDLCAPKCENCSEQFLPEN